VRLLDPEKVTLAKLDAFWNAELPILVTPLGIVMLVKRDASMNAESLILVTPLGIVMLVKLDALWNALLPILVRLLDPEKVTLVKLDAL
jgi:hypothetical protein